MGVRAAQPCQNWIVPVGLTAGGSALASCAAVPQPTADTRPAAAASPAAPRITRRRVATVVIGDVGIMCALLLLADVAAGVRLGPRDRDRWGSWRNAGPSLPGRGVDRRCAARRRWHGGSG